MSGFRVQDYYRFYSKSTRKGRNSEYSECNHIESHYHCKFCPMTMRGLATTRMERHTRNKHAEEFEGYGTEEASSPCFSTLDTHSVCPSMTTLACCQSVSISSETITTTTEGVPSMTSASISSVGGPALECIFSSPFSPIRSAIVKKSLEFIVIIWSTVRSYPTLSLQAENQPESGLGFLSNPKLLNTAITRTKLLCIFVGACVEPCVYFGIRGSIVRFPVQASTGTAVIGTKFETVYCNGIRIGPLALDHAKQRIFWYDVGTRQIYRASFNGSNVKALIKYGVSLCEGIAYDWSTDNIYWTDYMHDWIEVASADGKNRMVLIQGNMEKPRAIAVTPLDGYLFWIDLGSSPRIERATLDGKDRRSIVTTILVWPNDIAIDFSAKRVYWIDGKTYKIWSVDYAGGGRRYHANVPQYGSHHILIRPYSMALFAQQSLVYLTDWYRSIVLYQKLGTTNLEVAVNGFHPYKKIGQVRLSHSSNQPASSSRCAVNSTLCSHICMKNGVQNYTCACPTGMRPSRHDSQNTCQKADLDYQILLLDGKGSATKILHISKFIGQPQYLFDALSVPCSGQPLGIDFDQTNNILYWTDLHQAKIIKMFVNGTGYKVLANEGLLAPEGLSIDVASQLLYFAHSGKNTIEVLKLDGSARSILISANLFYPTDIQLYHEKGLMFFSDGDKIESAYMDGTRRLTIISTDLYYPSGLAIDKVEERIYWSDSVLNRIESSHLDGSDRRILYDHYGYTPYYPIDGITRKIQMPVGLAVFRNRIFWTDWYNRAIYSADKRTGGKVNLISGGLSKPMQLHVYSNKTRKDFKMLYYFSHARVPPSVVPTCFQKTCNSAVIEQPTMCPPGFKQTRLNTTCSNCTTNFGSTSKRCSCSNWMTCAHRVYQKYGCTSDRPFLKFMIRECVQVVNVGFCPMFTCKVGEPYVNNCTSDEDCSDYQKCCNTSCGTKCLNSTTKPALHPCEKENGGCSHFCFRLPRGHTCGCPDTMLLQPANNKTCISKLGACVEPCVYFGIRGSIARFPVQASTGKAVNGTKFETVYGNGFRIGPLALDHAKQRIFWYDVGRGQIYGASFNGSNVKALIKYGVSSCEGIAYDWSTDNIYWTDTMHDWIEVASADGKNRMVLIQGNMEKPRAIAVTPLDGYIFWTDCGSSPRIERATLDGKDRRSIVTTNLIWPNDIAIDFSAKRAYWIDAKTDKIWSVDYAGGGRRYHADVPQYGPHHILIHPYSMALFAQHSLVYLTDWYRSIVLYQILGTTNLEIAVREINRYKRMGQVRLLHSSNQPASSSQCAVNSTLCSHICMKNGVQNYTCACPTGMRPSRHDSQNTCQKADLDYQILLLDGRGSATKILHISKFIGQPQYLFDALSVPCSGLPFGIDFDQTNNILYWTDSHQAKIIRMFVNGTGYKVLVNESLLFPQGLSIDVASQLLYFAHSGRKTIEVLKLDGSARKILISTNLVNPRDIQLYHEKGLMFFSNWGRYPKIESAYMDGTRRLTMISTGLSYPSGLAIDKVEERIYWSNLWRSQIESSHLDGSDRRVLYDHYGYTPYYPIDGITGYFRRPRGLAVFRNRIFWTHWSSGAIYSADKRTGGKVNLISGGLAKPTQLHVYSKNTRKDFKMLYYFSHARVPPSVVPTCFQKTCNSVVIEQPTMCPPGFKQTRLNTTCSNCTTNFESTSKRCSCSNWMTCAHRVYQKYGCTSDRPFMKFTIRECVQVVNAGFCPVFTCKVGEPYVNNCTSDEDCSDYQKCCNTSCGTKCLNSTAKPALHPCEKENGGCSHFCFRLPRGHTCGCPDTMLLQPADNKTCISKSGNNLVQVNETSSSKRNLAIGLVVGAMFVVFFVLLIFYLHKRRQRNERQTPDVVYQSHEEPRLEIRKQPALHQESHVQGDFKHMRFEDNSACGMGHGNDAPHETSFVDMEMNDKMTGVANPYAELPDEKITEEYVMMSNSAAMIKDSPLSGLTPLDAGDASPIPTGSIAGLAVATARDGSRPVSAGSIRSVNGEPMPQKNIIHVEVVGLNVDDKDSSNVYEEVHDSDVAEKNDAVATFGIDNPIYEVCSRKDESSA
eukprot:gene2951-3401_t